MSIEEKFDLKKFVQRIYINAAAEKIYDMFVKGESLVQWYAKRSDVHAHSGETRKKDESIKADDEFSWEWFDGSILNGRIIEAYKNENVKFTFGKDVTVNINLKDCGDRTLVELLQEQNIPDYEVRFENYLNTLPGWIFYLLNLKSVCEGGIDLREKNPDAEMLINI